MISILENIRKLSGQGEKLLAVLIDPDKMRLDQVENFIRKVNASVATHIFVGGSTVEPGQTHRIVQAIKTYTILPIIIFPGDITQITHSADALLFLSLISGRNSDYLIDKHVQAVSHLRSSNLEVIPTGYILIENGKPTTVEHVTGTKPMRRDFISKIVDTAKAGEFLGMQLIYLEAGSGATHPITDDIISAVKGDITIPLIVGGGIRDLHTLEHAYQSGADLVVIGTALEEDESFFEALKRAYN